MEKKIFKAHPTRRLVFFLLIVCAWLLQFVCLPRFRLPFPVLLLIPITVTTAMNENEFSGLFFGLFSGALWDLTSPLPDGLMALLFACFGCLCGLLSHYVMRNTLLTALVLNTAFSSAFSIINMLFSCLSGGCSLSAELFLRKYLPGIVCSVLLTQPINAVVRKISLRFRRESFSDIVKG